MLIFCRFCNKCDQCAKKQSRGIQAGLAKANIYVSDISCYNVKIINQKHSKSTNFRHDTFISSKYN